MKTQARILVIAAASAFLAAACNQTNPTVGGGRGMSKTGAPAATPSGTGAQPGGTTAGGGGATTDGRRDHTPAIDGGGGGTGSAPPLTPPPGFSPPPFQTPPPFPSPPILTPTPFQPTPTPIVTTSLTGTWYDDLGRTISITQTGASVQGTVTAGDACYAGALAYFDGQIAGTTLYGTLRFCPDPGIDDAPTVCGYPVQVSTTFQAEVTAGEINGLYDSWEYGAYPCRQSEPVPTFLGLYRE